MKGRLVIEARWRRRLRALPAPRLFVGFWTWLAILAWVVGAAHASHPRHGGGGGGGAAAPETQGPSPCTGGRAGDFPCDHVDLGRWFHADDIGGGSGNDVWGWTDPLDGREYALFGRSTGTSFVDVTDPDAPVYLGDLPSHSAESIWRSIKVYGDHAFIASEDNGHGLQIFDLTQLRSVLAPPVTFSETAHFAGFGNAHTLAINEDTGMLAVAGNRDVCNNGLLLVDVGTPTLPLIAGCVPSARYVHETQCVNYQGPDAEHAGKEICFNSSVDALAIVDITSRAAPVTLSRTTYLGNRYAHQAWLTEDHRWLLLDDELDEAIVHHPAWTYIVDLADLDAPVFSGVYNSHLPVIDHNLYVRGSHVFQSNYAAGLRILDLTYVADNALCEIGFFDVYPSEDTPDFVGAWSNYPFFPSGTVVVSALEGLAVLKPQLAGSSCPLPGASPGQGSCIAQVNRAASDVVKVQAKEVVRCMGQVHRDRITDVDACLEPTTTGRVGRKMLKTLIAETTWCSGLDRPSFGFSGSTRTNAAAVEESNALLADLFGSDVAAGLLRNSTNRDGTSCQAGITRLAQRVVDESLRAFRDCKTLGLEQGTIVDTSTLRACFGAIAADQRVARAVQKLADKVLGKCNLPPASYPFPGCQAAGPGWERLGCIRGAAECRVCRLLNRFDYIDQDCSAISIPPSGVCENP